MMFTLEEIKRGLQNDELFAEYIPTVRLSDRRCVGAETLIRWRHEDRIVPPMDFIPLVENTWLAGVLTFHVIETVARELGPWLREQDSIVHVSINVPPEVIGRGGLMYSMEKCGLIDVVHKIIVEVTERGLLDSMALQGIRDAINSSKPRPLFALDDLGCNDAGLLVLSRVPADIVKLEKSFADGLLRDDWCVDEIAGLSALARTNRLSVVAEGVETERQVKILTEAGIQMAQGSYFSVPLSGMQFMSYFAQHQ